MANRLLTIDGNIDSGKTTLLAKLKEKYADDKDIIFLREPVDEWESIKNEEGTTMLQLFYANQEKYSFPFQMMAFISRYALLKDAMKNNSGKIIFTERSLFTDKFVFAKMLHDMGKIEGVNYQIYNKWFDTFSVDYPVHHCIYVKTDPEICHERIMKRSRTGEDSIPLDYLTSCNKYHDEMITNISHMFENPQEDIIELNGNVDIFLNPEEMEEWLNKIDRLIYI
jgi:deoxyadenosine/deoxycytidine kinase